MIVISLNLALRGFIGHLSYWTPFVMYMIQIKFAGLTEPRFSGAILRCSDFFLHFNEFELYWGRCLFYDSKRSIGGTSFLTGNFDGVYLEQELKCVKTVFMSNC